MSGPGVEGGVDGFKALVIDMGITLGGGDVGMAQHFLDDAEGGLVGEEVGGEGVTKGVGGDGASDTGFDGIRTDHGPEGFPAQRFTTAGEKKRGRGGGAGEVGANFFAVLLNVGKGSFSHGDDTFLAAFAEATDVAGILMEVGEAQGGDFGDAQACGVHDFEDGTIAKAEGAGKVGCGEEGFHFGGGQRFGEGFPEAGGVHGFGHVDGEEPFLLHVAHEHANGDEATGEAGGGMAAFAAIKEVVEDVFAANVVPRSDFLTGDVVGEGSEVVAVGGGGMGAKPFFGGQVIKEGIDDGVHGKGSGRVTMPRESGR